MSECKQKICVKCLKSDFVKELQQDLREKCNSVGVLIESIEAEREGNKDLQIEIGGKKGEIDYLKNRVRELEKQLAEANKTIERYANESATGLPYTDAELREIEVEDQMVCGCTVTGPKQDGLCIQCGGKVVDDEE